MGGSQECGWGEEEEGGWCHPGEETWVAHGWGEGWCSQKGADGTQPGVGMG